MSHGNWEKIESLLPLLFHYILKTYHPKAADIYKGNKAMAMATPIITREMLLAELNSAKSHLERLESMLKLLNLPSGELVAVPAPVPVPVVPETVEKKRGRPKGAAQSDGNKAWQSWVEYVVRKYADLYTVFLEKRKAEGGEKRGNTKAMFATQYKDENKEEYDAFISEKKEQLSQTSKDASENGSVVDETAVVAAEAAAAPVSAPESAAESAPESAPEPMKVTVNLAELVDSSQAKKKVKIVKKVVAPVPEPVETPAPAPAPESAPVPAEPASSQSKTKVKVKVVRKVAAPAAAPAAPPTKQSLDSSDLMFSLFTHNGNQYLKDNHNYIYERDDVGAMGNFVGKFNSSTNSIEACSDPYA